MNYLGHFWLDEADADLRIGNFIADTVKGKQYLNYPVPIQNGIKLHRFIDDYTDKNANVLRGVRRLYETAGKFAPVVSDILIDHVLAKHWAKYHHQNLSVYAQETYALLRVNQKHYPEKMKMLLDFMSHYNWLHNYAKPEGFKSAVINLGRRVNFPINLESCVNFCIEEIESFEPSIFLFLEQIKKDSRSFIKQVRQ